MKNRTARNGKAQNGCFLSRAGVWCWLFWFGRSPKEKNDGTARRGLNPPAYMPVISVMKNDKERHGTTRNGKAEKGDLAQPSPAKESRPALFSTDIKQGVGG